MSEEQTIQNEEKTMKVGKCTIALILSSLALLLATAGLILSILIVNGGVNVAGVEKKVVISQQYDKGKSLDKALETKKPMIVFFYTDWCGFCQRFVPTFHKVSKNAKIKQKFAIAYVNCEDSKNSKHVEDYNIHAFPTVFVVKENGEKVQLNNETFFNENSVETIVNDSLKVLEENKDKEESDD